MQLMWYFPVCISYDIRSPSKIVLPLLIVGGEGGKIFFSFFFWGGGSNDQDLIILS